jgi:5'-3' exonuclease
MSSNTNTIYKYFTPTSRETKKQNIIFVDGSYFCFYRFHAILGWMKHKRGPEFHLAEATEEDQKLFINTFKSSFIETLNTLPKMLRLNAENTQIIISQDCPREKIWRTELYPEYKGSRKSTPEIGKFFQLIKNENLFQECHLVSHIVSHPHLEADDCIALSVKHLHEKKPNQCIYIIASDKDYLQLAQENIKIIDLKFFLTNMKYEFKIYNQIYADYFKDNLPCRTTIEINCLPTPIAIELKVIATID